MPNLPFPLIDFRKAIGPPGNPSHDAQGERLNPSLLHEEVVRLATPSNSFRGDPFLVARAIS